MNKSELSKVLAKELDLPSRKAEEIVDKVFESMAKALYWGDRIEVRGFGSFAVREYESYTGRNPATGEEVTVGNKKLPIFKFGKEFRERLNQK